MLERVRRAREEGRFEDLASAIPYGEFLGITVETDGEELLGRLRYSDHLIGNARVGALHGGTVGALLESTAIFELMWRAQTAHLPRIVNITVEYLRSGRAMDTWARAVITRQGRRVANVRVTAWQDDPERPIAAANAHFLLVPVEEDG